MASDNEDEQIYNFDSHSTDDDLYRSKQIDNDEEEPTNELVNIDSIEHAKLIGDYLGLCDKLSNLPMNRLGYLNFIHSKKAFKALDKKQQILAKDPQIHHPSINQLKQLDDLFDKVSDMLDDDELEAKLTKFKDGNTPAPVPAPVVPVPAPVPAPAPVVPAPTYYDPFKACITIKPKEEPKSSSYYDPHTAPITTNRKPPEQWDNEKLLEEYYIEKQLKEAEWEKVKALTRQVKTLTKQLEDTKKQIEDYNKYKMFYIKNNGTDTFETQKDIIKNFIDNTYTITNNIKDRYKPLQVFKKFNDYKNNIEPNGKMNKADMDIRRFCLKLAELGLERITSNGSNYFIGIKLNE